MSTGRTRIKICGVRDEQAALAAVEAGADALGFVFHEGSPRAIDPDRAQEIAGFLPPFVTKVALVVDVPAERIAAIGDRFAFDAVQLHGSETPAFAEAARGVLGCPLIKALDLGAGGGRDALGRWNACGSIDALLVDGSAGGSGRRFDWGSFDAVRREIDHPIIVAGGLDAENVGEAVRTLAPYAVDVSSGVERSRGVKDAALIARFCAAVRRADADIDQA